MSEPTPFERLAAASPFRARYKNRVPDPGIMVVRAVDWERGRASATNGSHSYFPTLEEIDLWQVGDGRGEPDHECPVSCEPALWRIRQGDILRILGPYVNPDTDQDLTSALALATEIYRRVRLEEDIRLVEQSSSFDYYKAAVIDWLRGVRRWLPVHSSAWDYQLEVVPPQVMIRGLFMCGEAYSDPFHLTFANPGGGRYYCCLLSPAQVFHADTFFSIPFADDLPMLGIPRKKEAEP